MTEIINFNIEFVKRTKEIIDSYNWKYEFTLLINSLLWLIFLARENKNNLKFLKNKIIDIKEFDNIFSNAKIENNDLWDFLFHFRNAIAHMNIIPQNKDSDRESIEIWDEYYHKTTKNRIETFPHTNLTYDQIKIISDYISSKYIEENE